MTTTIGERMTSATPERIQRWFFTSWIIPFDVETSDLRSVRSTEIEPGSARIPVLFHGHPIGWIGRMWGENGWLRGRGVFGVDPPDAEVGKRYPIGSIINAVKFNIEDRGNALHYVVDKFQLQGVALDDSGDAWPMWQDSVIELISRLEVPKTRKRRFL